MRNLQLASAVLSGGSKKPLTTYPTNIYKELKSKQRKELLKTAEKVLVKLCIQWVMQTSRHSGLPLKK